MSAGVHGRRRGPSLAVLALVVVASCSYSVRSGYSATVDGPVKEVYSTAYATLSRLGMKRGGFVFTPLRPAVRSADLRRGRYSYGLEVRAQESGRSLLYLATNEHRLSLQWILEQVLEDQRAEGRNCPSPGYGRDPTWLEPVRFGFRTAVRAAAWVP